MNGVYLLALLFALLASGPAAAWGPDGHEAIALIAQDNLTPAAKKNIRHLFDVPTPTNSWSSYLPSESDLLAPISNWADDIGKTNLNAAFPGEIREKVRPETVAWHNIDLPIRKNITVKDELNYCPNNDCIIYQLNNFEKILGDESKPKSARFEALKFVVNLMGDLHQPLHCANDDDREGNQKFFLFKAPGESGHGEKINLFTLWDNLIAKYPSEYHPRELANDLEKKMTEAEKVEWCKGRESDWAMESYMVAKNDIYKVLDPGPHDDFWETLPDDYFEKMRPIVDNQLEKAGIRLAYVLNNIFK